MSNDGLSKRLAHKGSSKQLLYIRRSKARELFRCCIYSAFISKRSFKKGYGTCSKHDKHIFVLDCIGCKWFRKRDVKFPLVMKKILQKRMVS